MWQRKRLEVLERAGFRCARCGNTERSLHAHHKIYLKGRKPWEYEDRLLECLCELCHETAHEQKDRLDLFVAYQPTALLPGLIDAVVAAASGDAPPADIDPQMRSCFAKLSAALSSGDRTALVDAQNELQDLLDVGLDYLRGAGG